MSKKLRQVKPSTGLCKCSNQCYRFLGALPTWLQANIQPARHTFKKHKVLFTHSASLPEVPQS